jgi:hypothetical protein
MNRLAREKSPYLLQHRANPVDWYPWGEEAFAKAAREGKPIFLSIGYSTCHWCHVMERESFEDEEIAAYLNRTYIAVKVDREQRPDLDGVYMSAVQMMTGSGGWPMTVWLTPERKPFFGGTYFPPRDGARGARRGFLTLLQTLRAAYDEKPDQVVAAAQDVAARLAAAAVPAAPAASIDGRAAIRSAAALYRQAFDRENGGFGGAPKFPRPVSIDFLLRYARRSGEHDAREMAVRTLEAMHAGGLYDHVGGGFHRYATDARWRVPHFEKMLYDNALLAIAYLEAFQVTGREDFAAVVRETLAYVAREMTSPDGGFYTASDADSEGGEGAYFVWTPAELEAVLGRRRARWFSALHGVTPEGNFDGRNVLRLALPQADVASAYGLSMADLPRMLVEARRAVYDARRRRPAPHIDRKILVSSNALMASAHARAALAFRDAGYLRQASRAVDFIVDRLVDHGRLRRSAVDGRVEGAGYLDDYAFLIQALLDLAEAGGEIRRLRQAMELQRSLDAHFWDAASGGYFLTADDSEPLLARAKPDDDGAEPSGNSIAVLNLLRLAELTGDDVYRKRAEQALDALSSTIANAPAAAPKLLAAVDFATDTPKEIAIVKASVDADAGGLMGVLERTFVPNRVLVIAVEGAQLDAAAAVVPWLRDKTAIGGRTTAYVCERFVCDLPTTKAEVFEKQIGKVKPL